MIDTIDTLNKISFYLAIFGFILLLVVVFIVWKNDLVDYYRIKRGKPRKGKVLSPTPSKAKINQYYSDYHSNTDDSHEIINTNIEEDSENLSDRIVIGVNKQNRQHNDSFGEEETELLKTDDSETAKLIQNASGSEETTLLQNNTSQEDLDETDKIDMDLYKIRPVENFEMLDETELEAEIKAIEAEIADSFNEGGSEETTLLNQQSMSNAEGGSEETTLLNQQSMSNAEDGSEETTLLNQQNMSNAENGSEETTILVQTRNVNASDLNDEDAALQISNDSENTTLLDINGEEETTILSKDVKRVDKAHISDKYWAPQAETFVNEIETHVIVTHGVDVK